VIPVDSRGPTKMATDQKEKEKGMDTILINYHIF